MKKFIAVFALAALSLVAVSAASANYGPHGGGHTPVTICHKPGTPAEKTLTVDDDAVPGHLGHGDYLGECQETETPPPFDQCPNIEGNQPEGTNCNPVTPPTNPPVTVTPPKKDCTFVGADKDGGKDAYGGTNDDCAPFPSNPITGKPIFDKPVSATICPVPAKPAIAVRTVVKWKTKIVYRTKIKVVTKVVTKVVVKKVKVYVPGLHPDGVEGKG